MCEVFVNLRLYIELDNDELTDDNVLEWAQDNISIDIDDSDFLGIDVEFDDAGLVC